MSCYIIKEVFTCILNRNENKMVSMTVGVIWFGIPSYFCKLTKKTDGSWTILIESLWDYGISTSINVSKCSSLAHKMLMEK